MAKARSTAQNTSDYAAVAEFAERRLEFTASRDAKESALWAKVLLYCRSRATGEPLGEHRHGGSYRVVVHDRDSLHRFCAAESDGSDFWAWAAARAILELLSATERVIYLLVVGERLTVIETAKALGFALGTAQSLLHRARKKIDTGIYPELQEMQEDRDRPAVDSGLDQQIRLLSYRRPWCMV